MAESTRSASLVKELLSFKIRKSCGISDSRNWRPALSPRLSKRRADVNGEVKRSSDLDEVSVWPMADEALRKASSSGVIGAK